MIRKGQGRLVEPTIGGHGLCPSGSENTRPPDTGAHPHLEAGPQQDMFVPPPLWRYVAKDRLRSPDVPAVVEFRELLEETEKQAKSKP